MTKVACRGCQEASLNTWQISNAETVKVPASVDQLLATMQIVKGVAPLASAAL
jgi:hypothetical protein